MYFGVRVRCCFCFLPAPPSWKVQTPEHSSSCFVYAGRAHACAIRPCTALKRINFYLEGRFLTRFRSSSGRVSPCDWKVVFLTSGESTHARFNVHILFVIRCLKYYAFFELCRIVLVAILRKPTYKYNSLYIYEGWLHGSLNRSRATPCTFR